MALPLITGVDEAVAMGAGAAWEPNANAATAGFSAGVELPVVEAGVAPKVKPELGAVLVEEGTGSAAGLPPPAPNVKLALAGAADFTAPAAPAPAPAPNVKLAPPDGAFVASAEGAAAALKPPNVALGLLWLGGSF